MSNEETEFQGALNLIQYNPIESHTIHFTVFKGLVDIKML